MGGEFGKNVNESRNPEGRWITAVFVARFVADGRCLGHRRAFERRREDPRGPPLPGPGEKSNGVIELVVRMFGCTREYRESRTKYQVPFTWYEPSRSVVRGPPLPDKGDQPPPCSPSHVCKPASVPSHKRADGNRQLGRPG